MELKLNQQQIEIERDRTITLRRCLDVELVCVRGCLWITEDGMLADHFLRTGESRSIRSNGRVMITAIEPSTMRAFEPLRRVREPIRDRIRTAVARIASFGARGFAHESGRDVRRGAGS